MFWNRKRKAVESERQIKPEDCRTYAFRPKSDITIYELIEILQHYKTGGDSALPRELTEIPIPDGGA